MPVSAGTAYVDVAPRLHRMFSQTLTREMLGPATQAGDKAGKQAGDRFGKGFAAGTKQGSRPVLGVFRQYRGEISALVGAFAAVRVAGFLKGAIDEARDAAKVTRQTEAALRATGGAAKVSAADVDRLATSLSNKAGVDDELIASGANLLLTFRNVRNEAGRGNDVFNQAETAIVDMTAAMNNGEVTAQGLKASTIQVGKALNDPIKGMTALTRVGVTFTDQQKEQVKTLVASGRTMDAQKIILKELSQEFGGAAAAAADPWQRLSVTFGNVQESIGTALLPAMSSAVSVVGGLAEGFIRLDAATGGLASKGLLATGGLAALGIGVGKTIGVVREARDAWVALRGAQLAGAASAQVAATAEAELSAATWGSAAAATAGASKWRLFAGALGIVGGALAVGATVDALTAKLGKWQHAVEFAAGPVGLLGVTVGGLERSWRAMTGQTDKGAQATKGAADTASVAKQVQDSYAQALGAVGGKQAATAATTADLTAKLKEQREGFRAQVQSVRESIQAYDGLINKSDVTTKEVIGDLHNQVSNFRTYSHDVQRLIRAGVNPAAIQELSQKGPQYVHALAAGSNRELQTYKRYWHDRQAEVRGSFAESMQRQYEGLVAKIRAMQREINRLTGKNISITASLGLQFSPSFTQKDWVQVRLAAGRMAKGGKITQGTTPTADDVVAMLSRGETVVPARDSARPEFKQWAAERRIPGFAAGGPVGKIATEDRALSRVQSRGTSRLLDRGMTKLLSALGGRPDIISFIRSTDPLPYIWGGAGPGGYDCSGLVGAVLGKMLGMGGAGHGLRLFTTDSIRAGAYGLRPGLGGSLQIGVTPGRGHMAGRYGTLGFEAESTRTGIKTGAAASRPESFARHYSHLARGGLVDREMLARFAELTGADIGGDEGRLRVNGKVFDSGGWLLPGTTVAQNRTGRPERVLGPGEGAINLHVELNFSGPVIGDTATFAREVTPQIRRHLKDQLRREGKIALASQL